MKRAILLVSFGTSYREAGERSLECIYKDLCGFGLQVPVYQAYTSKMILERLSDEGLSMYSVEEAVQEILLQGVESLVVTASHMIPGLEYQKIFRILEPYQDKFQRLAVTPAVLQQEADCNKLVPLLQDMLHFQKECDYILMGHGTEDAANIRYRQMNDALWKFGYENVQIASVEAEPGLMQAVQRLSERGVRKKVILHPFMVVAGDHANHDMAGEKDSYLTELQKLGYEAEAVVKGLGEYPQFRQLYIERTRKALGDSMISEMVSFQKQSYMDGD